MTTSALKNGRRRNIDRTRGQLGDTMEELTHRIHVPARVRDKVNDAKQTVRVKTEEVVLQAPTNIEEVVLQAPTNIEEVVLQAPTNIEEVVLQAPTNIEEVTQQIPERSEALHLQPVGVAGQAERLTPQVLEKLPSPVAARLESLMTTARQRQLPAVAVVVGILVVLLLVLRRLFCRST
ncbi:MAG: DUF3618 domain-containing protein [Actinomycetota bacterium]|nr:DUF3618 domain-containing protein [Actinomycetota bacterium]